MPSLYLLLAASLSENPIFGYRKHGRLQSVTLQTIFVRFNWIVSTLFDWCNMSSHDLRPLNWLHLS